MNIRFNLPKETEVKVNEIIKKSYKEILLNSRLIGVRTDKDWLDNLTEDKINSKDLSISNNGNMISFENLGITQKILYSIQQIFPKNRVNSSGFFHYPPTGYMGWHTNSNFPCQRLYLTYTKELNKSFFRYKKDSKIFTDYDDKGLTVRLFDVKENPLFWHCVGSETDRLSFGFSIR